MGYIVRKLKCKNRAWKVQYQTYKGGRSVKDIRSCDYQSIGIHSGMDVEEVRLHIKHLNTQQEFKRRQECKLKINERLTEADIALNAILPEFLRAEFEEHWVKSSSKNISYWRTCKKLINEIRLPIEEWEFNKNRWYAIFSSHQYSADYVQKLIHTLNKWGKFVSYKQRSFFLPIPFPTGLTKQKIIDSYEDKGSTIKTSEPITPEMLDSVKDKIPKEHHNWLYLSIWLGLRPKEVDSLHKPPGPRSYLLKGNVLWVYQSKLTAISHKYRVKPIPLKYPEQVECLNIIESKEFKRPLNKTLIKLFKRHTTCYGGRKGFFDLMKSRNNGLEAISSWMGHKSLDRTWRSYRDEQKVFWD